MAIKHLVQCGKCGKEVSAEPTGVRFRAPWTWLTLTYERADSQGMITVSEERFACPDCTPDTLNELNKLI